MDGELRQGSSARARVGANARTAFRRAGERLARGAPLLLLLDLDGTLADFELDPSEVHLPAGTRRLLDRFSRKGARVVIVTGRAARNAAGIAPGLEIIGLHGREHLRGGRLVRKPVSRSARAAMTRLLRVARSLSEELPGSRVEDKRPGGVALHTRGAKRKPALRAQEAFARAIRREGLERVTGKRVVEARVPGCTKGTAALDVLRQMPDGTVTLFAGDDVTDEDAHRALAKTGALTVLVSKRARPSHAKVRVPGIEAFARALAKLAWSMPAGVPTPK